MRIRDTAMARKGCLEEVVQSASGGETAGALLTAAGTPEPESNLTVSPGPASSAGLREASSAGRGRGNGGAVKPVARVALCATGGGTLGLASSAAP